MNVDFSNDIKLAQRQMNRYVRQKLPIPKDVLTHYNNLLSGAINQETVESGQADDFPSGSLTSIFPTVNTSSTILLTANPDREYLVIQNIGANDIYLNFGGTASIGGGYLLSTGEVFQTQIPQFTSAVVEAIAHTVASTAAVFTLE